MMGGRGARKSTTAMADEVEGMDASGTANSTVLIGSKQLVHEERRHGSRILQAVKAALADGEPAVTKEQLRSDAKRVEGRQGLVAKSLEKVACDERLWDLYLQQHPLAAGEKKGYPSKLTVVMFAAWTTRTRQRACLAQRDDAGAEREGLGRHNTRCVLTQLSDHVWERRYPRFASLPKTERREYWADVLEQFDGLHKAALGGGEDGDDVDEERAAQLTAQTAPVTERKHFYRTEVHQLQVS